MPGTLVTDALEPDLLTGADVTGAASDDGDIAFVGAPGLVSVVLESGTPTSGANDATLEVVVQGSDSSTFADGVVTYGTFNLSGTDAAQASLTRVIKADVHKKYMRASTTVAGTTPDYDGASVTVRQPHWHQTESETA
jgi:hypothetical protein